MIEFRKEYKIKDGDSDYGKNILASFGLELINLLKECPIKIYSVSSNEFEKEDKETKEKYNVMSVIAKITRLEHKNRNGKCVRIGNKAVKAINKKELKKRLKNG